MKTSIHNKLITLIKALAAGGAISLGGFANIHSQDPIVGSLFFCIGLFVILVWELNLYTGKLCNLTLEYKNLLLIYLGNFLGCFLFGTLLRIVSSSTLIDNMSTSLQMRVESPWYISLIRGFLCNLCIFIAVRGYNDLDREWKKLLSLILGVSVFVLCRFEHCVADMFYITLCNAWNWKSLGFLMLVTIGNTIGGITIPIILKLLKRLAK